ncbi:hypothetical protein D3C80_1463470 [compost metagenome]
MAIDHFSEQCRPGEVAERVGIAVETARVLLQARSAFVEVCMGLVTCEHFIGDRIQQWVAWVATNEAGVVQAIHAHFLVGHRRWQQQPIGWGAQFDLIDRFALAVRQQEVVHVHVQPTLMVQHPVAQHIGRRRVIGGDATVAIQRCLVLRVIAALAEGPEKALLFKRQYLKPWRPGCQ